LAAPDGEPAGASFYNSTTMTSSTVRTVLAVVAGDAIFAGGSVLLFYLVKVDPHGPAATNFIVLSIVVGIGLALAGGFVAALSANRNRLAHAGAVGCLQMLAGGITMLMIRHPTWFVIAAFLIVVPSALLGALLATLTLRSPPTGPQPYDMRQKNMAC
jgi:drug/metabolite transporter (DMT)-like permease